MSTTIGNCRSLPRTPTVISIFYTLLVNVKKMLINIGQKDTCVTLDESIFQLAKEIHWSVPYLQDMTIVVYVREEILAGRNFGGFIKNPPKFAKLTFRQN